MLPHGGFAAHRDGLVRLVAGRDEAAARTLLRAVLARTPEGRTATVSWLTPSSPGRSAWRSRRASSWGSREAIFRRGDTGALRPLPPQRRVPVTAGARQAVG